MKAIIKRIVSPLLQRASRVYLAKARKYSYKNISVLVEPTVFPPFITISTKLLLEFVEMLPLKDKTFLELGCGCGIISILAAQKGAKVTSTDINQIALDALQKNAAKNYVFLAILHSDLFENLYGKSFDFIVINPPYYPKTPQNIAENAWFCGENFEYFEDLFKPLPTFLYSKNRTFMILSEDCEIEKIKAIALKNEMAFELASERKVLAEKNFIFRIMKL